MIGQSRETRLESVLVVGAGIAGLCTALRLCAGHRRITLLERDRPPPEGGPDVAFDSWRRNGVGQLRQSHAFLARLRNIIRDEHPELLADLHAAGCRDIAFADLLPPALLATYVARPEDDDLTILTSRRTTLELVMRRYVERLPGVSIRSDVKVRSLLCHTDPAGCRCVTGVVADAAAGREEIVADIVIDAGGKAANLIGQLIKAGAIAEEAETAGVLYFTRHYRLCDGQMEPQRTDQPGSGDLGYLKFGVFPGDNGRFSITLCVPEIERGLRAAVADGESFQRICMAVPGLQPWVDPARADPVGRVIGMGDLHSRWRSLVTTRGEATVLGYFAIGDSLVRTNPLYGRGCSIAAVSAGVLRNALDESADPAERVRSYAAGLRSGVRPYYDLMVKQDRSAIRRARAALTRGHRSRLKARITKSFIEDGVTIAARSDIELMRALMRGFHMLEHPEAWLKRPRNLARVLRYWARGRAANASAYPPKAGPDREALLPAIGIDVEADMVAI